MSAVSLAACFRLRIRVAVTLPALLLFVPSSAAAEPVMTVWAFDLDQAAEIWERGSSTGSDASGENLLEGFAAWTGWPEPSMTIDRGRPAVLALPYEGLAYGMKGFVFVVPTTRDPHRRGILEAKLGGPLAEGEAGRWRIGEASGEMFHLVRRGEYLVGGFRETLVDGLDASALLASRDPAAPPGSLLLDLNPAPVAPLIQAGVLALESQEARSRAAGEGDPASPSRRREGEILERLGGYKVTYQLLDVCERVQLAAALEEGAFLLRSRWLARSGTWLDRLVNAQHGTPPPSLDAVDPRAMLVVAVSMSSPEEFSESAPVSVEMFSSALLETIRRRILDTRPGFPTSAAFALLSELPADCLLARWQLAAGFSGDRDDLAFVGAMRESSECASVVSDLARRVSARPFEIRGKSGVEDPVVPPSAPKPEPASVFRLEAPDTSSGAPPLLWGHQGRRVAIVAGRFSSEAAVSALLAGTPLPGIEREAGEKFCGPFDSAPGLVGRWDMVEWNVRGAARERFTTEAAAGLDTLHEQWKSRREPLVVALRLAEGAAHLDAVVPLAVFDFMDRMKELGRRGFLSPAGDGEEASDSPQPGRAGGTFPTLEGGTLGFGDEQVIPPVLIPSTKVSPKYPLWARLKRTEGRVILAGVVETSGRLTELEVLHEPDPNRGLTKAALRAVRKWRYEPCRKDGEPVACRMTIVVDFKIEN